MIPAKFRSKVSFQIRQVMLPTARARGDWAMCKDIAADLRLHPHTVYNWFVGRTLPNYFNLTRWAEWFDVSLDPVLLNERRRKKAA